MEFRGVFEGFSNGFLRIFGALGFIGYSLGSDGYSVKHE